MEEAGDSGGGGDLLNIFLKRGEDLNLVLVPPPPPILVPPPPPIFVFPLTPILVPPPPTLPVSPDMFDTQIQEENIENGLQHPQRVEEDLRHYQPRCSQQGSSSGSISGTRG